MSSHREAPEISKDPVADSTDVYMFRHPTKASKVVLIANFIPLQQPDGGPNFYEFGTDVLYDINISNTDKCEADITYRFKFSNGVRTESFLYNTGQINNIKDETWNRPQFYKVSRITKDAEVVLARTLRCPPVNVGKRSTPNYPRLARQATYTVGERKFFCGQRADAFHVDLGSIFDLGALRPFQNLHLLPMAAMDGINSVQSYNVHTVAIEVELSDLTRGNRAPTSNYADRNNVVGMWATASRQSARVFKEKKGKFVGHGPWKQVSRLGMPLFNEVIVPMGKKDAWNAAPVNKDSNFAKYVNKPELQTLLPALYPGVFPNLAAYDKPRADLNAILLTGIPDGVVPGFQNYTGPVEADMLRINLSIPATAPGKENEIGLVAGDPAGFPNGRRIGDDVVAIELKAIAGATIPLVDPSYTPDDAASQLKDGTTNTNSEILAEFPFLGHPGGGFQTVPGTTEVS